MQTSHVPLSEATQHAYTNWEAIGANWRGWRQSRRAALAPGLISYGTIILAIMLTALLQALSPLLLDDDAYFLIFIPAVMTAAFLGGFRAGALVTCLSLATTLDSLGETAGSNFAIIANSLTFGIVAIGLSVFGDFLHRSRHQPNASRDINAYEPHLTSILETMPGAMVIFDEAGTLRRFNQAAEHLFGYTAGEVIGRPADMLIESKIPAQGVIAADIRPAGGTRREVLARHKNGSTFPIELVLGEWRSGTRRYFSGLALDLTERQHARARLQALQTEMIHASRLSMMGAMASAMAHELNQPLSAIANYLRGLKYAAMGDRQDHHPAFTAILDKTADQALRAGQIISRLRDLIARGETDRRFESIGKLIDEAGTLALVGTRERGIQVAFSLAPEGELVLVDRVQVQQVLLNLIRNAVEAMAGSTSRCLTISAAAAGDMLTVRVEDTGTGVAPDVAGRLFEPFTTTKRDGMGIGLSISRTIIESHGGKIWHEAPPGGGAAFCFTIPRVAKDEIDYVS